VIVLLIVLQGLTALGVLAIAALFFQLERVVRQDLPAYLAEVHAAREDVTALAGPLAARLAAVEGRLQALEGRGKRVG
jgi:hypothetical protein